MPTFISPLQLRLPLYSCCLLGLLLILPALAAASVHPLVPAAQDDRLRIQILSQHEPEALRIAGEGGGLALYAGDFDEPIYRLEAGESAIVSSRPGELYIEFGDEGIHALSLRVEPASGAMVTVQVEKGTPLDSPTGYPGTLTIDRSPNAPVLRLINHVHLEDYVACVLGGEYGLDDIEGNKAMAVAIRTYALRSNGKYGDAFDHTDHVLSQRYEGTLRLTEETLRAARETQGEVLTYNGQLIESVYFSSSGGHTANNEAVWEGKAVPYLRGKEDPYDSRSPHSEWRKTVSRAQLLQALSRYFDTNITGFYINDRSPDGRVHTINLIRSNGGEQSIRSNRFRLLVNQHLGAHTLKSTFFDARRSGSRYVFEGKGFGHGVGLSQWGAHGQALQGRSYREILTYYFTDVRLQQMDDVSPTEPSTPDRPVAEARPPARSNPSTQPQESGPPSPAVGSAEATTDTLTTQPPQQDDSQKDAETVRETESTDQKPPPRRRIGW